MVSDDYNSNMDITSKASARDKIVARKETPNSSPETTSSEEEVELVDIHFEAKA